MDFLKRTWNSLPALVRRVVGGLGMLIGGIASIAFAVFLVWGAFDGQFRGMVKPCLARFASRSLARF